MRLFAFPLCSRSLWQSGLPGSNNTVGAFFFFLSLSVIRALKLCHVDRGRRKADCRCEICAWNGGITRNYRQESGNPHSCYRLHKALGRPDHLRVAAVRAACPLGAPPHKIWSSVSCDPGFLPWGAAGGGFWCQTAVWLLIQLYCIWGKEIQDSVPQEQAFKSIGCLGLSFLMHLQHCSTRQLHLCWGDFASLSVHSSGGDD